MRRKSTITLNIESIQIDRTLVRGVSITGPQIEVLSTVDYILSIAERYQTKIVDNDYISPST
jgi:hypothetical protein